MVGGDDVKRDGARVVDDARDLQGVVYRVEDCYFSGFGTLGLEFRVRSLGLRVEVLGYRL